MRTTITVIGRIIDNDLPPTLSVGAGTGGERTVEVTFTVSLSSTVISAVSFEEYCY